METETNWFNEDDFCQREVLPLSNLRWCQAETWKILQFADAHAVRAEGRLVGFTDMYVRGSPPTPLSTLRISKDALADVLGRTLPRTDAITTGTASGPGEPCPRTFGFRGLLAQWGDEEIVRSLWTPLPLLAHGCEELDALIDLAASHPLLFVDWLQAWALPIDGAMPHRDAFFDTPMA